MRSKLAEPALCTLLIGLVGTACGPHGSGSSPATAVDTPEATSIASAPIVAPDTLPTPIEAAPPIATPFVVPLAEPTVGSLSATVAVDLLSCRYGPGAPYLFLYALRTGANIRLIGRTDGENWNWVYVDGASRCWVNSEYLHLAGSLLSLPVVYPGSARLPVSPYYRPTAILQSTRSGNRVTIVWSDVPLRAGDEEDARMLHYVVEAWHCEDGRFLFEPFGLDSTSITIIDEPGCGQASHARIFVQEKHGFAGPTDIPWPFAGKAGPH